MTRLFKYIALALCLIAIPANAGRLDYLRGATSSTTTYSADDCSGTLVFSWHAVLDDMTPTVTDGCPALPCGCADVDETGTANGSPSFSNAYGGGYALLINALDENFRFLETGASFDDIKITFDIYIVSFPGAGKDTSFFNMTSTATDNITLYTAETGSITAVRYCNSSGDSVTVSSLSTGVWYTDCEYLAKTGVGGNDHKLTIGAETPDEDNDALAASVTADNGFYIGEREGDTASTYLLRNIKVYAASGY